MTATAQQIEIPAGFVVVDIDTNYTAYHDGDNYATGDVATCYNPVTQETTYVRGDAHTLRKLLAVDADGRREWQGVKSERKEWSGWMNHLADIGEHAVGFDKGDAVEVYRGRKVPKGMYTIVRIGDGQYGPYADLKDAAGAVTRFISLDNIRHTPEVTKAKRKETVLDNCPEGHGETVWAFLFADSPTGEYSGEKLPILCDYIEDGLLGDVPPQAGRWIRQQWCK